MLRSKACSTGSGLLLSSRLSRGFTCVPRVLGFVVRGFPVGSKDRLRLGGGGVGGIKGSSG